MVLHAGPGRRRVSEMRASGQGAFERLAGQRMRGRRDGAALETRLRIAPDRLLFAPQQGWKIVFHHAHQTRHAEAIHGAQPAQHAGGGTDFRIFQTRQGGAADLALRGQLVQRPALFDTQLLEALGQPLFGTIALLSNVFHIWEYIPHMGFQQAKFRWVHALPAGTVPGNSTASATTLFLPAVSDKNCAPKAAAWCRAPPVARWPASPPPPHAIGRQ